MNLRNERNREISRASGLNKSDLRIACHTPEAAIAGFGVAKARERTVLCSPSTSLGRPDDVNGVPPMASAMKSDELESYRQTLESLRARLRGDLDQLTDEAFQGDGGEGSSNLSNVSAAVADVGTENYDQEFMLSLIENEQETLSQIAEAMGRIEAGTYGQCEVCHNPIAKPRLQALPYTRYCIECAREMEKHA